MRIVSSTQVPQYTNKQINKQTGYLLISPTISPGQEVTWHMTTTIIISMIKGYMVHVVKDETIPMTEIKSFYEPNIHQHGSIEFQCVSLYWLMKLYG